MASGETPSYFEDLEAGTEATYGGYEVTEDEILSFGRQYDPQPFHVDEAAAAESMFGGLVASGWHTASVCMRLLVEGLLDGFARAGGLGVDDLRWHRPVRPGDELSIHVELVEKTPTSDIPGMGEVRTRIVGVNQDDEAVVTFDLLGVVEKREP